MAAYPITFCQRSNYKFPCEDALFNGIDVYQYKNKNAETMLVEKPHPIIAVADGVSATPNSHKASRYWMEQIKNCDVLNSQWVRKTHLQFCDDFPFQCGSATTLVAAQLFENGRIKIVNVGDSRVYKITEQGEFIQLSYDHTVLNWYLNENKHLDPNGEYAEMYYMLSDCLIADFESDNFQIFSQDYQLNPNESLLLCSDGLTDFIESKRLTDIWTSYTTNEQRLRVYCQEARKGHTLKWSDDFSAVAWTYKV